MTRLAIQDGAGNKPVSQEIGVEGARVKTMHCWLHRFAFLVVGVLFIMLPTINQAQSLRISSSTSSTIYGQATTYYGSLSQGGMSGVPVAFYANGTEICSGTTNNSNISCTGGGTLSAGTYTVTAKWENQTSTNSLTLAVSKVPLTVTAISASSTYGATPGPFSASYSGFVLADTQAVLSGSPSLTTTATAASGVGTYTITAATGTLSAANYYFNFVNGTLTVNKALLGVTANATSTYGTSPGPFTASYSGFQNGDTTAVLSGSPSLTTTATSSSPVGSYTISVAVGSLSASNYSFNFANGILTITQANTVTSVSSNVNPSTYGQSVAYAALINTEGGTPTGSVTFKNGSTTLGTATPAVTSTTNLLEYSQQFTNSAWGGYCGSPSNITGNTTDLTAPDGSQTATKLVMPSVSSCGGGGTWGAIATVPGGLTTGQSYTASAWLRGTTNGEQVWLGLNDCSMSLLTLTTTWQRFSVTLSSISAGVTGCSTGVRGYQFFGAVPNSNETFYIWGAQLENTNSIGPYVATKSSSATANGGVASLSLSTLGAGVASITAVYAGDTNTVGSTSAALAQTVNKAILTVTANAASSTYGTTPGPFSASYSGFMNGDTTAVLSGSPSVTTTATSSSPVGTYPITPSAGSLSAANYSFSFVNGALTVNKATPALSLSWNPTSPLLNQSVTFKCSGTAGGQPVLNGATLTFSVNGANVASVLTSSGSASWSTSTLALGQNTIGCASGDSNYNAAQTTATVNVLVYDSGTVTLTVNSVVSATASYGASSTPDSIAAGLVSGITANSPVTLSQADGILYLTSKTTGSSSNLAYGLTTTWNQAEFTDPSFGMSPASGNLEGGDAQNASTGTIYSYAIPSYVYGSPATGYDAVGNVVGYTDMLLNPKGASTTDAWLFPYDTLNRLTGGTQGQNTGGTQTNTNYCWQYDAFGNRTVNYNGSCSSAPAPLVYPTSNQVPSALLGYDAAGDVTADAGAGNTYLYDAEGRICAVSGKTAFGVTVMTGYVYDAEGQRVTKGPISVWSCDPTVSGLQTASESDYVIGPGGEQLTEMGNGATTWVHTNVFANGELFATYDHDGLHFYANDWLGNRRVQTDYAGVPEQTCTNLPFGDSLVCSDSLATPTEHHFTGKERDTESGNDYFGARYFGSSMGRMMSPDPIGGDMTNPQSLNKYAYALNNPLRFTDPTGLYVCATGQDCSAFEKALDALRNSKNGDVARAAGAYGALGDKNGVTVGFADLSKQGEDGKVVSTLGVDDKGNLQAQSNVTINTGATGASFDAAIGHEGSHVADAQDVVKSIVVDPKTGDFTVGNNITRYQSEQRAYGVTNSILSSEGVNANEGCMGCDLGRSTMQGQVPGIVDRIMNTGNNYMSGGKHMGPKNQGGSVVNGVDQTPKAAVPQVPH